MVILWRGSHDHSVHASGATGPGIDPRFESVENMHSNYIKYYAAFCVYDMNDIKAFRWITVAFLIY